MTEAGSATWPGSAASTQRDRGNLQSFHGFDPTGPGRSVDAAPFRLVEAASIASLSTLRLGAAATTGLCCSFKPAQPKKALRAKPTILLHPYRDPATLRLFTSGVRGPSADATLRRIQTQTFRWTNYWRPYMHVRATDNYKIHCIKNILNLHT